ncbi:CapA family protein [Thiocystis violascens]|uniref:Putative enzyme of poly-gamma-glutamate biosynthesis (Capsule formation) n=1 Tax=Thiocystis violascens (strain ATCC 17096 / DSM 198 / 6111) TaxID=765911 RepID=I3Y569_THIV6|nr:CapA family protein [Thiocystis violascens]AFL72137.1 putative enzyme of poly-gamma-glutamate biosynthesis (capsule formation) [Thiocystis violascens DSM 198]
MIPVHRSRLAAIFCCACAVSGVAIAENLPPPEPTVTLAIVGDLMLDETPGEAIRSGRDPFASFAAILDSADIRVGNLECVVATRGEVEPGKPYTFRAHPRVLQPLKRHFDAVSLANNHSGDFGPVAFGEMLDLLGQAGIGWFGGGSDLSRAHRPLVIERHGLRIALLGYNEFLPRSFEADYDKPGIAWSEDEQVQLDIAKAREVFQADLVIPIMHWGWEHETAASPRQRQLARLMIDAGADAVVGGHPHVTQDIEQYRGKPVIYSLGNFVFNGFTEAINTTGWLLRLDLDRAGVRRWRIVIAHLDAEGIPHPAPSPEEVCWERGQENPLPCGNR